MSWRHLLIWRSSYPEEKQQKRHLMPADVLPTFTYLQRVTFYLLFTLLVRQIYKVSLKEMKVYHNCANYDNVNFDPPPEKRSIYKTVILICKMVGPKNS